MAAKVTSVTIKKKEEDLSLPLDLTHFINDTARRLIQVAVDPIYVNFLFEYWAFYKNFRNRLAITKQWSDTIKFDDLHEKKLLSSVYVSLDFYLTPKRTHIESTLEKRKSLNEILNERNFSNLIVLGGPGAGKTTLSKHICNLCITNDPVLNGRFKYPFLIRLREFSQDQSVKSISEYILKTLGIKFARKVNKKGDVNKVSSFILENLAKDLAIELLNKLEILLVLDGFDEIVNSTLSNLILKEVEEYCQKLTDSKLIITSRTGEFDRKIENGITLEICPLTIPQIQVFVEKWIENKVEASDLFTQIINSPFNDTAIRPINIAHLCALYLRYKRIPDKPKSVYNKIIRLHIEEWDAQRGVQRTSKYNLLTTERKLDFLIHLAHILTVKYNSFMFTSKRLALAYDEICDAMELPASEAKKVVKELENNTGLFINSGFDQYEFAHKSLQEYLTAEYIGDYYQNLFNPECYKLPNEFAISIALSHAPGISLYTMAKNLEDSEECASFLQLFITRLLLEKPDFTVSIHLAVAISAIYTTLYKSVERKCEELISALITSHKNIEKSFNEMGRSFQIQNKADVIDYLNGDLSINPFPIIIKQYARLGYYQPTEYFQYYLNVKMAHWFLEDN